jgi:hypothetical protein
VIVNASQIAKTYLRQRYHRYAIDYEEILTEHRAKRPPNHPYNLMLPVAEELGLLGADAEVEGDCDDSDDFDGPDEHR